MRAFVIADSSKRKAKPLGVLFWEADAHGGQGTFSLELSLNAVETSLPLSLEFCAHREARCATPEESADWVRSRIVPKDRHNIAEVLQANGLADYDAVNLLAASKGVSSDDDLMVYEIPVTEKLASVLEAKDASQSAQGPLQEPAKTPSRADGLISAVKRVRSSGGVSYACVRLPDLDASTTRNAANASHPVHTHDHPLFTATTSESAAKRIGAQIRKRRHEVGLTQKQLAVRAGITQAVVSRTESGVGNPTLALLEELAFALDASLNVSLG